MLFNCKCSFNSVYVIFYHSGTKWAFIYLCSNWLKKKNNLLILISLASTISFVCEVHPPNNIHQHFLIQTSVYISDCFGFRLNAQHSLSIPSTQQLDGRINQFFDIIPRLFHAFHPWKTKIIWKFYIFFIHSYVCIIITCWFNLAWMHRYNKKASIHYIRMFIFVSNGFPFINCPNY